MNRTTAIFRMYTNLARGLDYGPPHSYDWEMLKRDILGGNGPATITPTWGMSKLALQICQHRGIEVDRYYELGLFERPTRTANAFYCAELVKIFGDIDAPGFVNNRLEIPRASGLFYPVCKGFEIVGLKFYPASQLLKPIKNFDQN